MIIMCRYASIIAIESPFKEDDQQWLTYWVLYSFITLLELGAGPVFAWYYDYP
jgi:receptor expression-enhancing protein 5/6